MSMSRREVLQTSAAAVIAAAGGPSAAGQIAAQPRAAAAPALGKPPGAVVIASANGLGACAKAVEMIAAGSDPLDAVVAGVNLVEDDPSDHSVGLGGLPNEDGVVELDASVMHGPTHKAGAVASLQRIRNPSRVALLVMRRTDHVLLVGEGALRFARAHGFTEENLLTEDARRIWLRWKETHSPNDAWLHPEADKEAALRRRELGLPADDRPDFTWGTINCLGLTGGGDLAGVTTTSGLSYKIPGRVGDSPIIGAGLYVDNEVGAAGSTGRGEANLQNCSSFLVVELMRAGRSPDEACLDVLRRVAAKCEPRLRDTAGAPSFGLKLYALRKDGKFGGASLRGGGQIAVNDGGASRLVDIPALYPA